MKSATIKIFPSAKLGPVKPVNGVGQPPILGVGRDSLFHYLTEAGIPFSRLHDTGGSFGKNLYVDIPNLFRDFDAVRREKAPLDFFSYHSYAGVADTMKHVRVAREYADKYGFPDLELSLNEWLPAPRHDKLGTACQAAEIAAEMIGFQNGPVDSACLYDARCGVGNYSPLFNPLTYAPHKAYWAFMAFNELRKLGTAVRTEIDAEDAPGLFAAAAAGPSGALAAMLVNASPDALPFTLDLGGATVARVRLTDETRTWDDVPLPSALPPHSFLVASSNP